MTLPFLPFLTGDDHSDIAMLHDYLYSFLESFVNSAGEAIDPSVGQGADSSLNIVSTPEPVTYNAGVTLTADGMATGHIDVTFTKPDRTVDIIVFYRESGVTEFKQSYASMSPFRLISLKPDATYQVKLAGQAANGSLGPESPLTDVNIAFTSSITAPTGLTAIATYQSVVLTWNAPVSSTGLLKYQVQRADDAGFTNNVKLWDVFATLFIDDTGSIGATHFYRVRAVDRIGNITAYTAAVTTTTLNVPNVSIDTEHLANEAVETAKIAPLAVTTPKIADDAVTTVKVLNKNITYAKIQDVSAASRLLLRGSAAGAGVVQEGTVGTGLTLSGVDLQVSNPALPGTYTPTLTNIANLDSSAAYVCQYVRLGSVVVVSGQVDVDPTAGATSTQLGISLPIASNFTAANQCAGTAFSPNVAGQGAAIVASVANDRAEMHWVSADTANRSMFFIFMYLIA